MTIHMRPYAGAADLQRILDLKRTCTTPENRYDTPIFSELRALLAPLPQDPAAGRPPWEDEQGRAIGHLHRRALARQATTLWEEDDGRLLAYALVAPPSTVLTFQVHPQARDSGLETQILTWAIAGAQEQSRRCERTFSLWCRRHEHDLDLIAVDAAGTFAAFCLCELTGVADSDGEYTVGEIGVIGTRPTHQGRGLGLALLLTGMHRLKERGATGVFLETELAETPALRLFTSVGFRRVSAWQWMIRE